MQAPSGILLHGRIGEKFVNHYTFYAAFSTEENTISAKGRILGTLPVAQMIGVGQRILSVERPGWSWMWMIHRRPFMSSMPRWACRQCFRVEPGRIHSSVRQRMRRLLASTEVPVFSRSNGQALSRGRAPSIRKSWARKGDFLDLGKEVQNPDMAR